VVVSTLRSADTLPENGRKLIEHVRTKHLNEKILFEKMSYSIHELITKIPDKNMRRKLATYIESDKRIPMLTFMEEIIDILCIENQNNFYSIPATVFLRNTGNLRQDKKGNAEIQEITNAILVYLYDIKV
jgi:hypothetical protein